MKKAVVHAEDISNTLLLALNFFNMIMYCNTLHDSGNMEGILRITINLPDSPYFYSFAALVNEYLWLVSHGIPEENLKIKAGALMLLDQLLRIELKVRKCW